MFISEQKNISDPLRLTCLPPEELPSELPSSLTIYRDSKDLQKVNWFESSTKFALKQDGLVEYAITKMDDGGEFRIEGSRIELSGNKEIDWRKSRVDRVSYAKADWGFSYYEPRLDKLIRKTESDEMIREIESRAYSHVGTESKNKIDVPEGGDKYLIGAQGADKITGNAGDNIIASSGISWACSGYGSSADYSEKTKDVLTGGEGSDIFYVGHGSKIKDVEVGEKIFLQNDSNESLNGLIGEEIIYPCSETSAPGESRATCIPSERLDEPRFIQKRNKTIVKMGGISFTTNAALLSGNGSCFGWEPCEYRFEVLELL